MNIARRIRALTAAEVLLLLVIIPLIIGVISFLVITSVLLYSYVLTKLWLWFLVPTFGLPPIGMAQGYGLALIAAMLTHQQLTQSSKEDEDSPKLLKILHPLFLLYGRPLFTLLFGWVAHQFLLS